MTRDELLRVIEEAARTEAEELDLSFKGLTKLPPEIGQLTNLKKLNLRNNQLSSLPTEIGQLSNLSHLYLNSNQLDTLPSVIKQLYHLNRLNLSNNQLSSLPTEIGQLSYLTWLNLSNNKISSLSPEIRRLSNLTYLNLISNKLSSLPPEIGQLSNLSHLYLNANRLDFLPPEIGKLSHLNSLDLICNQLSSLPPEIGQLSNLSHFYLSGNQIRFLPREIGQLSNLSHFYLSGNQIRFLSREIGHFISLDLSNNDLDSFPFTIETASHLTSLNLNNNKLHSLPLEIEKLSHLTSLNLSNNKLSSLPPEIGKLSNLTSLDLSNNKIRSFPPEIGKLSNLTSLDLSNNKIRSLPPEIGKLSCLNLLKLGSNNLNSLPLEIGQITCLSSLDLNSNHLSSLPPEIGQINNLIWLNLRNNQLSYFPLEIGQLSNLCSLDLSYNHLKELPTSFRTLSHLLPKLEELDLRENPLPIPPEILYKSGRFDFKSILEFYFSQQQADEDNCLYEAKFLIVGEGGAGKTSLMKKIKKPDYELNLEEKSTHGIDVVQWCFELENGQEFRVNIWDFGGQEIYHQTHQFFLTRRSLYALVADTRKENTDFPYWLSSIEIFGSNSPVLIIENEKEDQPCSINKKQLRGDFEYIAGFLPTNLKDGRGLEEIKDAIRYEISKLDHVGMAWPKEWADIRRALEEDTRNTISKQDYFEICAQQGVTDQEKMLRISDFLHQLGICLHFQNDRVLKNILILRPEWATNAVYAVTNNPRVKQALGCFSDADLTQIWSDPQYAHLGDELLQLMEKFKLCYPIPGLSGQYIAPQLLDFNPPDYDWDNQQNLMLRYEYEFMPKGIITQLIVRLYRWIEKQQIVWRSGVVFNNGRARAEVIETYRPYKGEVRIQVVGLHPKELLSIITNEIDEINSSFEKIRVTKKIPCICEECKTDPNPYFFDLATLDRALTKDRQELPCNKSFINVRIRHLTDAVLVPKPVRYFEEQFEQSRFDRLKDQHTEYPPVIVEFVQALTPLLEQLQTESEESSIQTTESAPEILEAEILEEKITAIQTQKPKLIQNLRQKFRNLPQNLRDRDRLLEALREATVTLVTDLADNPALNTLFALLGPLLSDPDEDE